MKEEKLATRIIRGVQPQNEKPDVVLKNIKLTDGRWFVYAK